MVYNNTFGPSGPGAPGIPLGPCRPVGPSSPLSPGIPRSPWKTNMTSWISDSQTPAWTDWNQCSSPTLGPIWPTGPSSPGIPWKKKATFLMLSPKKTWNLNSSKTFCNNNLVLDITQGYFHSFCWTHLVTWFPRLSRRPLISRQTLRTHKKRYFSEII